MQLNLIILIISIIFILLYAMWAHFVNMGWKLFASQEESDDTNEQSISIVIPFRNEAENLDSLLESLSRIDYPREHFEIVLVDDHSDDHSVDIINNWNQANDLKVKLLASLDQGKKSAQKFGIEKASFELIACTDADCTVPQDWLKQINQAFSNNATELAFGGVLIPAKNHAFQSLEFLSLIGTTLAMLKMGWPVMGNGANMAFKKESYLRVFSALSKVNSPSGDDVFLLHEIGKNKGAIGVISSGAQTMKTQAQKSFKELYLQRIRWASKTKKYHSKQSILVALLVFGINLLALIAFVLQILSPLAFFNFLLIMIAKSCIDYFLLKKFARHFQQPFLLKTFLILELFNLIYVPAIGFLSQLSSYSWKGRRY